MKYNKHKAVKSIKPNSEWNWKGFDYANFNWLSSDTKPTESEINAEVTRLNNAEPMRLLRLERNIRLTKTDYMALSDVTMTEAWKTYRQSLRDLPASASPKLDTDGNLDMSSVTFPTEPS